MIGERLAAHRVQLQAIAAGLVAVKDGIEAAEAELAAREAARKAKRSAAAKRGAATRAANRAARVTSHSS